MTLPEGQIAFVDNQVPALLAGEYAIEVHQQVTGDGVDAAYPHQQSMRVLGPHFTLDAGSVHACYPPGGSTADYTESLASIVLSRSALPWVISAGPGQEQAGPLVTPWLMLLLLTPEEIVRPVAGASPTGAHPVPLADYLTPGTGIVGPDFTPAQIKEFEADNPTGSSTLVVDIAAQAFTATAPTLAELPYLAHARDVDGDDSDLADKDDEGFYSVVLGNRLARGSDSGIYIAHLVSVEGFTTRLPPSLLPPDATTVRMVSLASWTFDGTPGHGNFPGLMAKLGVRTPILPTRQPVDPSPTQQVIAQAVAAGYVGLDYQTRFAERTVCWYRGPALPLLMEANPQPPYEASSQGLIYDPATGMFDVSYAVAWETGRMTLLSNRAVTTSLLGWLRRQQSTGHLVLERLRRARNGRSRVGAATSPSDLTQRRLISDRARSVLAARLSLGLTAPGGVGLFGAPTDPSGLRGLGVRLPGLRQRENPATGPSPAPVSPKVTASREPQVAATARDTDDPSLRQQPRAHALRNLLSSTTARSLLDELLEPLPDDVVEWLAQRTLLTGLPFTTIVPDARMLPAESIGFFHLDQNWTAALLDGALSVIDLSEWDSCLLDLQRAAIHEQVTQAAATHRARLVERARAARNERRVRSGRSPSRTHAVPPTTSPAPPPWSGFLLRSAAVADWPGLTVTAYGSSTGGEPLTMLRLDRVAPTVLVGIAGGVIQRVRIAKPPTALHFGVVHQEAKRSATGTAHDLVYLRGLGGRFAAGTQLPQDPYVTAQLRPDTAGRAVLQIAALQSEITSALVAAYQPDPVPQTPPVPSAAFGLQLMAGAEAELFIAGGGP